MNTSNIVTKPRSQTPATSGFAALAKLNGWLRDHRRVAALVVLALMVVLVFQVRQWQAGQLLAQPDSTSHGPFSNTAINSVAVLPFANVGDDSLTEYLPDGITESLIRSLSQLPTLSVMARGAVFAYKGREIDPRQAGAALKVRAVVTGHVQRQGERLVISVELVDAASGAHLWGEEYRRPMADLLAVQQEITREITEALRLRLSGSEQRLAG